jgi:hypothetical protein
VSDTGCRNGREASRRCTSCRCKIFEGFQLEQAQLPFPDPILQLLGHPDPEWSQVRRREPNPTTVTGHLVPANQPAGPSFVAGETTLHQTTRVNSIAPAETETDRLRGCIMPLLITRYACVRSTAEQANLQHHIITSRTQLPAPCPETLHCPGSRCSSRQMVSPVSSQRRDCTG